MKVFFSHASEDKKLVEQVFLKVSAKYPDIIGWLDKYEILGGDNLIETIHSGIENSDKFLIFLSPNSIDKLWVRTELRKALTDEINGIKPEFIIPIKVGHISQFPPFLESKLYIDIESKTEDEWLEDLYSAITRQKNKTSTIEENLIVSTHLASDEPNAAFVVFESQFWAEPISFTIKTKNKISEYIWQMPTLKGMHNISKNERKLENEYSIQIVNQSIKPKHPFLIALVFENTSNPIEEILEVNKWDGQDGEQSISITNIK
jgi:hypothetical protein